jgi:hypothetical protein
MQSSSRDRPFKPDLAGASPATDANFNFRLPIADLSAAAQSRCFNRKSAIAN